MGGYILAFSGWQSIFLALAAAGLLLWTVCWRRLPETRRPHAERPPALLRSYRAVLTHGASLRNVLTVCFS